MTEPSLDTLLRIVTPATRPDTYADHRDDDGSFDRHLAEADSERQATAAPPVSDTARLADSNQSKTSRENPEDEHGADQSLQESTAADSSHGNNEQPADANEVAVSSEETSADNEDSAEANVAVPGQGDLDAEPRGTQSATAPSNDPLLQQTPSESADAPPQSRSESADGILQTPLSSQSATGQPKDGPQPGVQVSSAEEQPDRSETASADRPVIKDADRPVIKDAESSDDDGRSQKPAARPTHVESAADAAMARVEPSRQSRAPDIASAGDPPTRASNKTGPTTEESTTRTSQDDAVLELPDSKFNASNRTQRRDVPIAASQPRADEADFGDGESKNETDASVVREAPATRGNRTRRRSASSRTAANGQIEQTAKARGSLNAGAFSEDPTASAERGLRPKNEMVDAVASASPTASDDGDTRQPAWSASSRQDGVSAPIGRPLSLTAAGSGRSDTDTAAGRLRIDPDRFVARVAKAFQLTEDRGGQLRLRLSPPELGSVRLELAVKNGAVTASIETETAAARHALLDNLPALRDRLADQNIRVEQFDVDVRDDTTGGRREPATGDRDQQHTSDPPHASRPDPRKLDETAQSGRPNGSMRPRGDETLNVVV